MRLWLKPTGEVSLREQLSTQITLAILCRELAPGERLPSTRELARRYRIHANTVSAAYRQLETEGWLELKAGSGVYVRATPPQEVLRPDASADRLLGEFVARARAAGASTALIRSRMRRWLDLAPPTRWLVIDPDPALQDILACEMRQALTLPIDACTPGECGAQFENAISVARPSQESMIRGLLPDGTELVVLQIRPVTGSLEQYLPHSAGALIGIASRWGEFQRIAHTMLIAAGIAPESLVMRDPARAGWKRGLEQTTAVICDALTEPLLPTGTRAIPFRLLDPSALAQLKQFEANLSAAESQQPAL